jgi:signal transduction histidine kinase
MARALLLGAPVSVASVRTRLPHVAEGLVLHLQMIESLPSVVFVCDGATGRIVEHNAAAARFFAERMGRRPLESLLGADAVECFPDFETTLGPLFRRVITTGNNCGIDELRLPGPGGGDRFLSVMVQPMVFDGAALYLMVSLSDITDQVLARERQQHLQRMESVGALAGGLAHDVNNMLCAIGGHTYLLRERPDMTPEALEELDRIDAALESARTLTGKLLTFARGGSVERVPVALNDVVLETVRILSGSLGAAIEVRLSLEPNLPPILADSAGLQQMLMNFFVNARDAMNGKGCLRIQTHREDDAIILEVEDSGPGIPEAIRARIFEPFFTTKKERGTGLGLSVAYGLVKNFGGSITVGEATTGGARFTVFLPAYAEI